LAAVLTQTSGNAKRSRVKRQDPEWALKVKAGRHDELRDYDAQSLQTYF
jgi:hypothetical protein